MTPTDSFNNPGRSLASLYIRYNNVFKRPMHLLSYEKGDLSWKLKTNYFNSLGFDAEIDTRPSME